MMLCRESSNLVDYVDGNPPRCYHPGMPKGRNRGKAARPKPRNNDANRTEAASRKKGARPGGAGFQLVTLQEGAMLAVLYAGVLAVAHFFGWLWAGVALAAGLVVGGKVLIRILREALWEQWKRIDRRTRDTDLVARGFDWRPLVILGVVAVVLTGNNYYGHRPQFRFFAAKALAEEKDEVLLEGATAQNAGSHRGVQKVYHERFRKPLGRWGLIAEYSYWVLWRVMSFFLLPMLVIGLLPGERFREYGLSTKGVFEHLWIYGLLFAVVFAAVFVVSFTPVFKYHYPFPWARYAPPGGVPGRQLLVWELMYAAQFFALEFFFRGFMLHSLKRSMGAYAIFAMLVPYTMIHFGKPLPETLGAFAAGLILGTLALATRSIWCGVLIHVSVALSMDVTALIQKGTFPSRW
jgi:membrane protease YdiL (CAAX protease family)